MKKAMMLSLLGLASSLPQLALGAEPRPVAPSADAVIAGRQQLFWELSRSANEKDVANVEGKALTCDIRNTQDFKAVSLALTFRDGDVYKKVPACAETKKIVEEKCIEANRRGKCTKYGPVEREVCAATKLVDQSVGYYSVHDGAIVYDFNANVLLAVKGHDADRYEDYDTFLAYPRMITTTLYSRSFSSGRTQLIGEQSIAFQAFKYAVTVVNEDYRYRDEERTGTGRPLNPHLSILDSKRYAVGYMDCRETESAKQ